MQILRNISLKPYNTFGIEATARSFATFQSIKELEELVTHAEKEALPTLMVGGGSNILLTQDFEGMVLRNELKGIEVVKEDEDNIYVRSAAGENWHQFVLYCVKNNFAGVENLSLIPGNVGASPIQNIGAYGVEIKDVADEVEAFHLSDQKQIIFPAAECGFGYRESIFKKKYKGQFVITSVTFKLRKKPVFNTNYGAIQQELDNLNIKELSIAAISQAVINIRQSKLPDPAKVGNAGSFFKNPTIPKEMFDDLILKFPKIVGYQAGENEVKVAAGWLIEQCGWKGYKEGDAGCHANQALVLVNYGNARGIDVYNLSAKILKSVEEKFGIILEREVNII